MNLFIWLKLNVIKFNYLKLNYQKPSEVRMILFKLFDLLYADDIVFFTNIAEELHKNSDILLDYCFIWKLKVKFAKN